MRNDESATEVAPPVEPPERLAGASEPQLWEPDVDTALEDDEPYLPFAAEPELVEDWPEEPVLDDETDPPEEPVAPAPPPSRPTTARAQVAPAQVPPSNADAEECVLGAMLLLTGGAIEAVRPILAAGDFYRLSHGRIYQAALDLDERDEPVDAITLAAELERRGDLEEIGGRIRVHELAALVPAASNAAYYARLVKEASRRRAVLRELAAASSKLETGEGDIDEIVGRLHLIGEEDGADVHEDHVRDGASFILGVPEEVPTRWGERTAVLWVKGEGLLIVGPDGVGKTTLTQQLLLSTIGLRSRLLGMPVEQDDRPVLYIAADRPKQAARSLRRMVTEADQEILEERLRVWEGPFDMVESPRALLNLAKRHRVGSVFIDSLKDVALDLSKDEVGSRVNLGFQHVIAEGIDLVVLHHQRKEQQGAKDKPKKLADVYGSRWITAGMGSVVVLWGEPGDPVVELSHLKQPLEEFGPRKILHDHVRGVTTLYEEASLERALADAPNGLTVAAAAHAIYGTEKPTPALTEKARRCLNTLVSDGKAELKKDPDGTARYLAREFVA